MGYLTREAVDFKPTLYNNTGAIVGNPGPSSNIQAARSDPGCISQCMAGGSKNKISRNYIMRRTRGCGCNALSGGAKTRRRKTQRGGSGYGFQMNQRPSVFHMGIASNGAEGAVKSGGSRRRKNKSQHQHIQGGRRKRYSRRMRRTRRRR